MGTRNIRGNAGTGLAAPFHLGFVVFIPFVHHVLIALVQAEKVRVPFTFYITVLIVLDAPQSQYLEAIVGHN